MIVRQDKNPPGLTQSEVVISIILVVVLLIFAVPFFSKMLKNIERTAVQQVVRQLNAAAKFKMAEYVALDKLTTLPEQLNTNPITWLIDIDELASWQSYKGEVETVNFDQQTSQSWVFNKKTGRLIYKLKYPELVDNNDPIVDRLQFKIMLDYVDFNRNKNFDSDTDTINGLEIVSVHSYTWLK